MTKEEHLKRHNELHKALDELVADMAMHTKMLPSKTSVMDLIKWAHSQCDDNRVCEDTNH